MKSRPQHAAITGEVANWLEQFAQAVRDGDTDRGRAMFDPNVLGFGSWTVAADGLDALVHDQWDEVWRRTRAFCFDLRGGREIAQAGAGESQIYVAAVQWSSLGEGDEATMIERRGRATIVLRRSASDGALRAVHTHFSLDPPGTLDGRPRGGDDQ